MSHDNPFAQRWVNLAEPRLGARAVAVSDEFFAPSERLLHSEPALFIPDKYDDHGKWMDGWETRRRRNGGHDWCVVRLGRPGVIRGVDIDTSHFTGNYPPAASLQACRCDGGDPTGDADWIEILPAVSLTGDQHHFHAIDDSRVFSHLKLNIYPDGGIARLRIYGEPQCDWDRIGRDELVDLLALEYGGRAIACNDQHFGSMLNLNLPGRGINMGDGWETRRRRDPGNDWVILALGHAGEIRAVAVDTAHFKGNYPDRCSIQGALVEAGTDQSLITQSMFWPELLSPQPLSMDTIHRFEAELQAIGPISHVRVNIFPDGGLSRVRLFGQLYRGR